jgi:hypothetical protein
MCDVDEFDVVAAIVVVAAAVVVDGYEEVVAVVVVVAAVDDDDVAAGGQFVADDDDDSTIAMDECDGKFVWADVVVGLGVVVYGDEYRRRQLDDDCAGLIGMN